jgi:putative redox protein
METIRQVYLGELRTQNTHVSSGYQVLTDVPKEHGGKGEHFSPTDLLCASLVSSMLSVMGGVARNPSFGASIDGTIARTTKRMKQNPHCVEEIQIEFDLPKNNFTEDQKKMIEGAARNSQVAKSLQSDLKQTLIFNY